ncbi:MAG TPA: RNA polymerase sigma factor [Bacteroidales bacterium]|nr:RNA polymerase sigma factor [Bacteroidales bacterium]
MIDPGLIEECRGGNLNNFRKVVEAAAPFAYSVAFRMLGDEDLAKDAVQETMVTVWQKLEVIKSPEGFKSWLYRIVINKCYDELRKRKRNHEYSQDEKIWKKLSETLSDNASADLENIEMAAIISGLTEKLSPKQKAVFILSDLEDMTNDEVALITGMSKLVVKANLYYARKNIKTMLVKYI